LVAATTAAAARFSSSLARRIVPVSKEDDADKFPRLVRVVPPALLLTGLVLSVASPE
jgi:multisubunit Na+/H+ antiporter MnhC subunit